jgi:hypothetical protein
MDKKKIYYILGGVALLGIGYYLWNRRNKLKKEKKESDKETGNLNVVDMPIPIETHSTKPAQTRTETRPTRTSVNNTQLKVQLPQIPLPEGCEVYNVDRMSLKSTRRKDSFNYVWFYLMNRPNQTDSGIRKGFMVSLTNAGSLNGTRRVSDVFIDANGKIGAIALQISKSIYKPFKDDTSLRNKGKINFKCPVSSSFEGLAEINQENTIRQKSFAEQVVNREDGRMFAGDVYDN